MNDNNRKQIIRIRILLIFVAVLVIASLAAAIWFTLTSYTSSSDSSKATTEATKATEASTTEAASSSTTSESASTSIGILIIETTESETDVEADTESESESESESEETTPEPTTGSYIVWVGDSRYVGMSYHAVGGDLFICKIGVGYQYLQEHFDEIVAASQNACALVLGLGVNSTGDPSAPGNYGALIANISQLVPCPVFVQLLGSTNEEQMLSSGNGSAILNSNIDAFNQYLNDAFINSNIHIISAEPYIRENNLPFNDGLHYSIAGYLGIYGYLRNIVISML